MCASEWCVFFLTCCDAHTGVCSSAHATPSIGLARFEVGPVERNPPNYAQPDAHASGVRLSRRHSGGRGAAMALGAGSALNQTNPVLVCTYMEVILKHPPPRRWVPPSRSQVWLARPGGGSETPAPPSRSEVCGWRCADPPHLGEVCSWDVPTPPTPTPGYDNTQHTVGVLCIIPYIIYVLLYFVFVLVLWGKAGHSYRYRDPPPGPLHPPPGPLQLYSGIKKSGPRGICTVSYRMEVRNRTN